MPEALDQRLDELVLEQDRVGAGLLDRAQQLRLAVARDRDQTERRMVAPHSAQVTRSLLLSLICLLSEIFPHRPKSSA